MIYNITYNISLSLSLYIYIYIYTHIFLYTLTGPWAALAGHRGLGRSNW